MRVSFRKASYEVVFTEHARTQMSLRGLGEADVLSVIESGEVKPKESKNKFWVYRKVSGRNDNFISVSISIEPPKLIVITAMVNWRPQ
jgi:hypothetical protein